MSKIIALVNRKGGSGKSTSCAYLAQCFHNAGKSVICLDYDPDQSLVKWHESGVLPFEVVAGDSDDLDDEVGKLTHDYVLLDTPPNDESIVLKAASIADECLVVLAATALDASRLFTTLRSVATMERVRNQPLSSVIITKAKANTNILESTKSILGDNDVPICDTTIKDSVRYQGFVTPTYLEEYQALIKELEL